MSCDIVLGGQWGDEGKAKMVDFLAQKYEVVCRFQGGANAGHTVKHNGEKYVFHLLPSGILHPQAVCVLGSGMVIDLTVLLEEIELVEKRGISIAGRIVISSKAFLVLDYHILLDRLRDEFQDGKIGTTIRGIGPTYEDRVGRVGVRVSDLSDPVKLREKIEEAIIEKKVIFKGLYKSSEGYDESKVDEMVAKLLKEYDKIKPFIKDTTYYLNDEVESKTVLLEGAQGMGLDINFGSYPYVTSSSTTSGGAMTGTGIGPKKVNEIYGVFKAYITRVGGGVLPTTLSNEGSMEELQRKGGEVGATTGRMRDCGWFDGVQAKYSVMVNGLTGIALTKLDVLTGYKKIKFCTHYEINGEVTDQFPDKLEDFENAKAIYQEFDGWDEDFLGETDFSKIPTAAKDYLKFLETYLNCKVKFFSTGPERNHTITF